MQTISMVYVYPSTWVKIDATGDEVFTAGVSTTESADKVSLFVVPDSTDVGKAVKAVYDRKLSVVGVKSDIVSTKTITLVDGKTPATEVVVGAKIMGVNNLFGYALAISKQGKLIFITGYTFGDSQRQAFVKEIASTLSNGTDSSSSATVQSPAVSQSAGSTSASPSPSPAGEVSASLTISDVKYEIAPNGFPASAYDVTVTWTTSSPATSEIDYIRSGDGFLNTSYTLNDKNFGDGCPYQCDSTLAGDRGIANCWTECINKITYIKTDSKPVTDHSILLRNLHADSVLSSAMIRTNYKVFYLKVKSTGENNQTAESSAYSLTLE